MVTLHDEAGEVFTLPHYEVNTGWEFHGHTGWIPESDPRVLDWLETQFKKVDAEKWPDPVARERAATLLFYRQLLVRNGRADPSNDPSQRQQTTDEPLAPYLPNEASPTASKNCA